jgi:hypothetical protein
MALSLEEQSALNKAVKRAVLQGVSEKKITEILAQSLKEGQEATKAPLEAVVRLNQEASKAYQLQVWKGRAILMGFTFLGALADFALGPKNVEEWIRSGKLMEWGTRVGNSLLAMEAASLAEKQMRKKMEGQGGKETVRSLNPRIFRIRLVGLGTATVLFIAGEGLMAALQGEGSNEIGGRIGEAVLVLAIAEGSVMTAELLFAGEIGAFSGPVGIAIAIGVTALYEGGKHLWTARKEHDFDHRVFQARCEIAKQQITQWTDKTVGAVVRSTQQP